MHLASSKPPWEWISEKKITTPGRRRHGHELAMSSRAARGHREREALELHVWCRAHSPERDRAIGAKRSLVALFRLCT